MPLHIVHLRVFFDTVDVLKKYNPNLFGSSNGVGDVNVWNVAHLNAGVPGAQSSDLVAQARDLVHKMQIHSEVGSAF